MDITMSFYWRIRYALKKISRFPDQIRWWYQRARYGFSYRDSWSGDYYIAGVIAGVMERIVTHGYGVPCSYNYGDFDTPVEVMAQRRDEEWNKYIAIFREYSKSGPALNQKWKDDLGGVLDEDMQDALQWLSKHFYELWD